MSAGGIVTHDGVCLKREGGVFLSETQSSTPKDTLRLLLQLSIPGRIVVDRFP